MTDEQLIHALAMTAALSNPLGCPNGNIVEQAQNYASVIGAFITIPKADASSQDRPSPAVGAQPGS